MRLRCRMGLFSQFGPTSTRSDGVVRFLGAGGLLTAGVPTQLR
ncbi:hypothetical protein XA26_30010 [Mycolicibacterium fortuitum]|uniref:Uncharacterized protein n=1 Tax=Mycolicibacterium fortuitum TaxID=1766 RepID=A0A0N9XGH4_MYCFO|nr:hypothetical protein XA26_30010 [Mycolicibacterium fortuitum]